MLSSYTHTQHPSSSSFFAFHSFPCLSLKPPRSVCFLFQRQHFNGFIPSNCLCTSRSAAYHAAHALVCVAGAFERSSGRTRDVNIAVAKHRQASHVPHKHTDAITARMLCNTSRVPRIVTLDRVSIEQIYSEDYQQSVFCDLIESKFIKYVFN